MRNAAYPWTRWRIVHRCALVDVPKGWTLSARMVEPEGISVGHYRGGELLTWKDGALATLPVGLLEIRMRKGVHLS